MNSIALRTAFTLSHIQHLVRWSASSETALVSPGVLCRIAVIVRYPKLSKVGCPVLRHPFTERADLNRFPAVTRLALMLCVKDTLDPGKTKLKLASLSEQVER